MIVWNELTNDARVLKEAQTLATAQHDVTIFALRSSESTAHRKQLRKNIHVIRIKRDQAWRPFRNNQHPEAASKWAEQQLFSLLWSLFCYLARVAARAGTHTKLLFAVLRAGADIVHAHDVNVLPTAWLSAQLLKAPLVYDAHEISTSREGYRHYRGWVARIERWIMPRIAASITTTEMRAKFFARAYGIPRPHVLQNRPRYIEIQHSNLIRNELNLRELWPIVIYQGGLQRGRGIDILIQAIADIEETYLVLLGNGNDEQDLRKIANARGLNDRVFFIPTVSLDALPHYTASADIGVQPILNTCLNHLTTDSNKLFEYIMAGLPVVASKMPEIAKIVSEYEVGELVTPGNVEELKLTIGRLAGDADLRKVYAQRSRLAAKELSWDTQEGRLVDLYKRVLSAK